MQDHGKVRSTVRPDPMTMDEYSVWLHRNIREITENEGTEYEFRGYEYDCVQYSKNEYIAKQTRDHAALEQKLIDTELALCELYEMLG